MAKKKKKKKKKKKRPSLEARKNNPNSKYWMNKADKLWSKTVRRKWGFKCAMCGSQSNLQAHHLIAKKGGGCIYRHTIECGMCLCTKHHGKWGSYDSPHSGHLSFAIWLNETHPDIWQWVKDNITNVQHKGPYPKINYKENYELLLESAHEDDKKGN